MNKRKKIIIIVILCVIFVCLVPFILRCSVVGLFVFDGFINSADVSISEQQANHIATEYLAEKYPDKSFTIVDTETDEYYNGFNKDWYNTVKITVKNNDNTYFVLVDLYEDEKQCCDNVQEQEIKKAMAEELRLFANLSENVEYNFIMDSEGYSYDVDFYFREKFNGNITEFLEKERTQNDSFEIRASVAYVNDDENFVFDENINKFISLFDFVVYINFKEEIPKEIPYDIIDRSYIHSQNIAEKLEKENIEINSINVFEKENDSFTHNYYPE